ncbi:unnamed protein product [Prunus armeniaca]
MATQGHGVCCRINGTYHNSSPVCMCPDAWLANSILTGRLCVPTIENWHDCHKPHRGSPEGHSPLVR